jgi:hypothetical protein
MEMLCNESMLQTGVSQLVGADVVGYDTSEDALPSSWCDQGVFHMTGEKQDADH